MPRIIICKNCGEEKEHCALNLCRYCYSQRPEIKAKKSEYWERNYSNNLEYKQKRKQYWVEYCTRPGKSSKRKAYSKGYHQRPDVKKREQAFFKRFDIRAKQREYKKGYIRRPEIKEKIRLYNQTPLIKNKRKKYLKEHRTKLEIIKQEKEYHKEYYQKNKIRIKQKQREYEKNPIVKKQIIQRKQKRYKEIPKVRLSCIMRKAIGYSLKGNKNYIHWEDLVGYKLNDLKKHLEKQFQKEMTWSNYGSYWHIDHRIPVSWFNFKTYDDPDFKKCWSLNNLKPMVANKNLSKGNRYSEPTLYEWIW